MSEKIKPALTAEEWAKALPAPEKYEGWVGDTPEIRHYLAALNLIGQPFGFTREDVRVLRDEAYDEWSGVSHPNPGDVMNSIADRIEALLPPE